MIRIAYKGPFGDNLGYTNFLNKTRTYSFYLHTVVSKVVRDA